MTIANLVLLHNKATEGQAKNDCIYVNVNLNRKCMACSRGLICWYSNALNQVTNVLINTEYCRVAFKSNVSIETMTLCMMPCYYLFEMNSWCEKKANQQIDITKLSFCIIFQISLGGWNERISAFAFHKQRGPPDPFVPRPDGSCAFQLQQCNLKAAPHDASAPACSRAAHWHSHRLHARAAHLHSFAGACLATLGRRLISCAGLAAELRHGIVNWTLLE
jgi:hypothetical protein